MGGNDTSIQSYFHPTPTSLPTKVSPTPCTKTPLGDGFTAEEVEEALKPKPVEPWQPPVEYAESEIRHLDPGPKAVTFSGRVARICDVQNNQKTPKSARGCLKLCVKDNHAAITVRLWYKDHMANVRLGSLVSVWTKHISNGENGTLSSSAAPYFTSLFPERDRNCHFMVHEDSDSMITYKTPLGYQENLPLDGVMTLQNFIDGGYDVVDGKILVVVKSIGHKTKVTRKDQTIVDKVNLQVHDHTAEATLGLWGTSSLSPLAHVYHNLPASETSISKQSWKPGETILLLQGASFTPGGRSWLSLLSSTIVDIDPLIPDATWLRKWAIRQKVRESVNPSFPTEVFDLESITSNPKRPLFTLADLDDWARTKPGEIISGYLSLMIIEIRIVECMKRQHVLSGECCNIPVYANATIANCRACEGDVELRLNPRILGQVIDETGVVSPGKLLFSERAWRDLLGRGPEELLLMRDEEMRYLADRLLFCRISVLFGWTGEEDKAGGRICVLGVRSG